ncbi:glycoside hydrolase family 66 protein [Clostridium guangxiense]|uniref:glycoside hydrolase family 66 protein n=1 Tax=Clostridium guangxiense TaxID=1662055 RepID=UPI001E617831|nr:glycoside hydrolase family 66 protein [Clostridium guangxiense]MCD2346432.1 glycoside hydrolase family 66 protein [Clostridium guangxiense]
MRRKVILIVVVLVGIFIGYFAYRFLSFRPDKVSAIKYQDNLICDVYTDKARYNPKDTVKIYIKLNKNFKGARKGTLSMYFKYLSSTIDSKEIKYSLDKNAIVQVKWNAPKNDFRGYQIEVYAFNNITVYDNRNTAVDVSSNWSKFPRYGYIADYPNQSKSASENTINSLTKYHIDGLEFYDWQYKHNKPLAGTVEKPEDKWSDIANRDTYGKTIKDYIDLAHSKNMMAANYNLMFGAYSDYEADGVKKEWGLYKDDKHQEQDFHPLPSSWASSQLFLFNPANKGWQNYIIGREKQAMSVYKFDVFHVDTLGERGILFDYNGKTVELSDGYKDFLNTAKKELSKGILFNPVGGYGEISVAPSVDVDFLYKEVWPNQCHSYADLKQAIDTSRDLSKNKKSIVLAAYMNYNLGKSGTEFNEPGVRLTDASIFASGGAHIELGDTGMLCNEYFPNKNLSMTPALKKAMRNYYDFSVAYENLLRDGVEDSDNDIEIPNVKVSDSADANSVWAFSKKKVGYNIIHLINNVGNESNEWVDNDGDVKSPTIQSNLKLKYYFSGKPKKVWLASPDARDGNIETLSYKVKSDKKGQYLLINVPKLQYWDMICVEK